MILSNPSETNISLVELGITVPAQGIYDLRYKSQEAISASAELYGLVSNGSLAVLSDDLTAWAIPDALKLVKYGINPSLLGVTDTYPGIVSGRFYSARTATSLTISTVEANTLYAVPLAYPVTQWNRIGVEVSTSVANAMIRLGAYSNDNGMPGILRYDAGSVPASTSGIKEIVINYTNTTEWFWLIFLSSDDIIMRTINGIASTMLGRTSPIGGIRQIQAAYNYGALPNVFPENEPVDRYPPYLWVRRV